MAAEPISLFARIADPAGVLRKLRGLYPAIQVDGADDNWRSAIISFPGRKGTLTLTHDPAYYAEPNWSVQMNGMGGYFQRFPTSNRKERALMLPTTFKFSLGVLFDPDRGGEDDPRLQALYAAAEVVDGVLFTPSSFRDARGRVLFSADGEEAEDPEAKWPWVVMEVDVSAPIAREAHEASRPRSPDEDDAKARAEAPTPERVVRRALALTAVTVRAILEQEAPSLWTSLKGLFRSGTSATGTHQILKAWVDKVGIEGELEPAEANFVRRPLGKVSQRMQIDSTWRLEGLVVLAWALGRFDMPPHDKLVDFNAMWASLGWPDTNAADSLLARPTLRSREEICVMRNRLFALHWRLRNFSLRPEVMDFAEFARTAWFGPLDLTDLPLEKGDLAIGNVRLDRADADAFASTHSASLERHKAINWLWEGPEIYSEARTDT